MVVAMTTERTHKIEFEHEPYITTPEAAQLLRLSPRTLEAMRCDGSGPPFYKAGRGLRARVLYRQSDLERWLAEQCYICTAQYTA